MIYYIKKVGLPIIGCDLEIYNENEVLEYSLIARGCFLKKMITPSFSINDKSGKEIFRAKRDRFFSRNRHVLIQYGIQKSIVEQTGIQKYVIKHSSNEVYEIILSGFSAQKWKLCWKEKPIAHIEPDLKNWGWRVSLLSDSKGLYTLVGLALIYEYFQDA